MRRLHWIWLFVLFSRLNAEVYYEGTATFRGYGQVDLNWLVQFLPYNPIIVDAGSYIGEQTLYATKVWPNYKSIYALEPNPRAFEELISRIETSKLENVKAFPLALNSYSGKAVLHISSESEKESSLLPSLKERELEIEVPCATLDEWCVQNQIDHLDILRLELEGLELQVLENSPNILKNVKVLIVPSFFYSYRLGTVNYFSLKDFLVKSHFVPLAHWYRPGERGLAVYISEELFDAYFVRCLGLGLGGLLYP